MNRQAFLNLIKDPNNISFKDLQGLEDVIANFPFCQAAHILAAKGAHDQGKMLSEKKVRMAAAYALERKKLKEIIVPKPIAEAYNAGIPLKEEVKVIERSLPEPDTTIIPSPEITEKTDRIKDLQVEEPAELAKETPTERIEIPASLESKLPTERTVKESVNEKFFAELEENLRNLRSSKEKAAKGQTTQGEKEVRIEHIKPEEVQIAPQSPKDELNLPLLPESIKEHPKGIQLFSSRQDEVMEGKESSGTKPSVSEGELLLNYLSFLENHKNSDVKDKKKTEEIIEKFIKKDPSIPYMNAKTLPDEQEDKASQSYRLKAGMVSENMAKIYILQGKKERAIEIYQQLMLKSPEKLAYFVSQIEKIKGN